MELSWEIKRSEQSSRQKKILPSVLSIMIVPPFAALVNVHMSDGITSFSDPVIWVLPAIIAVLGILYYLFIDFIPFPNYLYKLNESGILIQKNKKSINLPWSDFEVFFDYSKAKSKVGLNYFKDESSVPDEREIVGSVLYLEKTNVIFGREFVVIKTEPDNTQEVKEMISKYIPEQEYKTSDDFGLKKIRFK